RAVPEIPREGEHVPGIVIVRESAVELDRRPLETTGRAGKRRDRGMIVRLERQLDRVRKKVEKIITGLRLDRIDRRLEVFPWRVPNAERGRRNSWRSEIGHLHGDCLHLVERGDL